MTPAEPAISLASQVPTSVEAALVAMGRIVAPEPTALLYAPLSEHAPFKGLYVERDLAYGTDCRNLLDMFRPAASFPPKSKQPIFLFLHGGAFIRGDRRLAGFPFYDNVALWAVRQGCIGVNMTYRLAPQHQWPAVQQDIATAVQWLRNHANRFGGDPNRIFIMGHSAGAAHVAQYLACPEFQTTTHAGVAGAVLLSGLFDPSTAQVNPPLQAYFGEDETVYPSRSAVAGLMASPIPLLVAYAQLDPPDFCTQSEQLGKAFQQGGKSELIYRLMGHSHMSALFSINTTDTALTTLIAKLILNSNPSN